MRIGLFEIGILVAVILVIFMVTRLWRIGKNGEQMQNNMTKSINLQIKNKTRRRLRIIGIVLIILGIVFLLANMSLFRWVMWSYAWLLVLIFIGLILVVIFRK